MDFDKESLDSNMLNVLGIVCVKKSIELKGEKAACSEFAHDLVLPALCRTSKILAIALDLPVDAWQKICHKHVDSIVDEMISMSKVAKMDGNN